MLIDTHFTTRDLSFLFAGFALVLAAVILFHKGKTKPAVMVLLLGGFAFRLMMAFIDPYVNLWDEQFHALVAKNLSHHFLVPTLVENPLEPLQDNDAAWGYSHIWLHKPPLFLWQMALTIKIFGAKAWAIRLPSAILSALMIPALYRMGKLVFNERTGFTAAVLIATSNLMVNMISGWRNTDQNDVVFIAYACFSFWTWIEYVHAPLKKWIFLTGLFAACAILTKWLPGLLVFGAWGVSLVFVKENRTSAKRWKDLGYSVLTGFLISAPWFIYIACRWPGHFQSTLAHFNDHLTNDMLRPGAWWTQFGNFVEYNGVWLSVLAVLGFIFFFTAKIKAEYKTGIAAAIIAEYAFYSFIPIQMPFFCFPVLALILIMIASAIDRLVSLAERSNLKSARIGLSLVLLVMSFFHFNHDLLEKIHTDRDPLALIRKSRLNNMQCFEQTLANIPPESVVFNCGERDAVPCMFYVNCTAFDFPPYLVQIWAAKEQHRPIYVFDDEKLPDYVLSDTTITILENNLIWNDQ